MNEIDKTLWERIERLEAQMDDCLNEKKKFSERIKQLDEIPFNQIRYFEEKIGALEQRIKKLEDTPRMVMCINCIFYRNYGSDGEQCGGLASLKEGLHECKHFTRG